MSFRLKCVVAAVALLSVVPSVVAQNKVFAKPEVRITAKVDNAHRVTLTGNTHPLAKELPDLGAVDAGSPMNRMVLSLTHSDAQEAALNKLIDQQQDKTSPNFHQWLTPAQYGAQFGASDADIKTVTDWLVSQGFTVNNVGAGRNTIEFSGNAGQVTTAFGTEIHRYQGDGATYQGNASDPSIPAALAPVVRGVIQLHNFPHGSNSVSAGTFRRDNATGKITKLSGPPTLADLEAEAAKAGQPQAGVKAPLPGEPKPDFTYTASGSTEHAISPYDFATIYNLTPLWNAGIDGTGQTIAIVQETNIHLDDVRAFRSLFGLPANDPQVILNGPDPGVTSGDEGEADIDVQWSGAVAKNATIKMVASASTAASAGVALSSLYIVDNNVAPIMSMSYGECELASGTTLVAFYNTLYQQAAAEGISAFVSTGDQGSAVCNRAGTRAQAYPATLGLSVNGWGSSAYNTAVGGTDFMGSSSTFNSAYWSATNNSLTQASALGYVPETTWNDNCTNPYLRDISFASSAFANSAAICQAFYTNTIGSSSYNYEYLQTIGGSGGYSNCTTNNNSTQASCTGGVPKPSYQNVLGVPADGKRDVPDVSLMAGNGFFGSFYVVCEEDVNTDGKPCNLASPYADFSGYGGTSISTPAFAGIMALVEQKTGSRQGNANYVLYNLFNQQVTAGTSCAVSLNATTKTMVLPASSCVFYDQTYGNNSSVCTIGDPNCTTTGTNKYGIMQSGGVDAWTNTAGYDLATGLGSVNAQNLVNAWATVTFVPSTTTLQLSSTSFAHGTSVNATMTVAPTAGGGGVPTGNVDLVTSNNNLTITPVATLSGGTVIQPYTTLPGGTYSVSANYEGDGTYAASVSTPVSVTVTPENTNLVSSFSSVNESTGALTAVGAGNSYAYGSTFYLTMVAAGVSGSGVPTGTMSVMDSSSTFATVALYPSQGGNSSEADDYYFYIPAIGNHSFTEVYPGDASFNTVTTTTPTFSIVQAPSKNTLTRGSTSITAGASVVLTSAVVGANAAVVGNFAYPPSGTVTFYEGATSGALTTSLGTAPLIAGTGVVGTNTITSSAKLTTANLPCSTVSQSDYITPVYAGDTNFTGSNATSAAITVAACTKTASTSSLSASVNPIAYGGTTVVSSTVTGSGGTPTGTVSFYVDGVINGTAVTLVSGQASGTLSGLKVGTHAITTAYSGDTTFLGSSGGPLQLTVTNATATMSLTPSATSVPSGSSIVFAAALTYTATTKPTGTINFKVDGATSGLGIAISAFTTGGIGSYFTTGSTLSVGPHTVTATYSGDTVYASTSQTTNFTITAVSSTTPLLYLSTQQSGTIVLGAPVTIEVLAVGRTNPTVPTAVTPTGTISYTVSNSTLTGSNLPLTAGATTFSLSGLNELQQVITVNYNGDTNYTATSQTINLNGSVAQTILFPALGAVTYATTQTVALVARSTSGLLVTYAVTGPATISTANVLTLTGTGTVTVTATQPGNASFAAATAVTRSFLSQ